MMTRPDILHWLRETDPLRLDELWAHADRTRAASVGADVHLRGLIEVSSHCRRHCTYCGLRAPNAPLPRYRMTSEEILRCAHQAVGFGYGTVVLQAGEDEGLSASAVADVIERIKADTPLAVTLSLGERTEEELALWRSAGADRYLLRFETSNPELFTRIHPPHSGRTCNRIALLGLLRELGYEIGSGVMIGIPGQTYEDLASDVELFAALDLDMIGVGPFLPHPATPLGRDGGGVGETPLRRTGETPAPPAPTDQVPNTEGMTYKMIALARLACPRANIPSTTALATLNKASGRELGLCRGANVVMPNLTPPEYRAMYEIYPDKACVFETAEACHGCMIRRIRSIGRTVGTGRGDSPNYRPRQGRTVEAGR